MERENFENLVEEYIIDNREVHYRLAFSYVKNLDDALDIVQESIYKAISNIDTLKTQEHLKTWFYRILVNTSIDLLRKRKRVILADDEFMLNLNLSTVDNYENLDLKKALEELPDKYYSIVVLKYFEDLKFEEIALILDENVNTVKTRLYKALKILHIKMDDIEEGGTTYVG